MAEYILIADSHVMATSDGENEFFAMLDGISCTSANVIFLGDNLDLWIASGSRYECELHRRFLSWCEREKARREVIYVEGNHEFYVCRHHAECFTKCTETRYVLGNTEFLHGDMTHLGLSFHRFFRVFAKNWFGDFVMAWLPFGVGFAKIMKKALCSNTTRKYEIPLQNLRTWSTEEIARTGASRIIIGHYHHHHDLRLNNGTRVTILPAWKNHGKIGIFDSTNGRLKIAEWRQVLHKLNKGNTDEKKG